jgi:hypothetical protein
MGAEMKKSKPRIIKVYDKYILPAVIKLGYQDITIIQVDSIDNTQGSYTNDTHEIKIKSGMVGREQLNTLLHELLHACVYAYGIKSEFGDDDKEEKVVNALGNGLTEVLVRNKELVAFIKESV